MSSEFGDVLTITADGGGELANPCAQCGSTFTSPDALERHKRTRECFTRGERAERLGCTSCPRTFKNQAALTAHENNVHPSPSPVHTEEPLRVRVKRAPRLQRRERRRRYRAMLIDLLREEMLSDGSDGDDDNADA